MFSSQSVNDGFDYISTQSYTDAIPTYKDKTTDKITYLFFISLITIVKAKEVSYQPQHTYT